MALITIEMLTSIQRALDEMLIAMDITSGQYYQHWIDTLSAIGWTEERYEREIDRRWDYVMCIRLRATYLN